jgi:hypothetical protein
MSKKGVFTLLPRAGPRGRLVTAFPVWVGFAALIPVLMVLACGVRGISFRRMVMPGARAGTQVLTTVEHRKERGAL